MALLSRILQKHYHTRYEKIILGRIRCEKAPQVVRAWGNVKVIQMIWTKSASHLLSVCIVLQQMEAKGKALTLHLWVIG